VTKGESEIIIEIEKEMVTDETETEETEGIVEEIGNAMDQWIEEEVLSQTTAASTAERKVTGT
jgi:predicted XRE-type DNA-binding protein